MRIPSTAPPEVQQAFREVWAAVDRVDGSKNLDLNQRRIINAGPAVDPFDYTTQADVDQMIARAQEAAEDEALDTGSTVERLVLQGFRRGSVLFVGSAGAVDQNPQSFTWEDAAADKRLQLTGYGASQVPMLVGRRPAGTSTAPTQTASATRLFEVGARGYTNAAAFSAANRASICFASTEAFTATAQGAEIEFHTTPTGGTTLTAQWRIRSSGALVAMVSTNPVAWGTTGSEPALVPSGANVRAMLADASADTGVVCAKITRAGNDITVETTTSGTVKLVSAAAVTVTAATGVTVTATSGDLTVNASGDATLSPDQDVNLTPDGDVIINPIGDVKMGTYAAIGAEVLVGYFEVKTLEGTTRKVGIIA